MNLFQLAQLSIEEFKENFEEIKYVDKYIKKESDLNILSFAFLNANYDVIKYLLENYNYNLKEEMEIKLYDIPLCKYVVFSYVMTKTSLSKIKPENFEKILLILKENNVSVSDFTSEEIENLKNHDPGDFFEYPYFNILINSGYMDNNMISQNLKYLFKNYNYLEETNILNLIINMSDYNPINIDFTSLLYYYSVDYDLLKIDSQKSNTFLKKMKEGYLKETGLTEGTLLESIINLYIINGDFFQEVKYDISIINPEIFYDLNLDIMLKKMFPTMEIILTQQLVNTCIDNLNINAYRSLIKMNPLLTNHIYVIEKCKNLSIPEDQKEDFSIIEKEMIKNKLKINEDDHIRKRI